MAWLVTSLEHPSIILVPGRQLSAGTESPDTAQKGIVSEFLSTLACQFWAATGTRISFTKWHDVRTEGEASPETSPRSDSLLWAEGASRYLY